MVIHQDFKSLFQLRGLRRWGILGAACPKSLKCLGFRSPDCETHKYFSWNACSASVSRKIFIEVCYSDLV